MNQFIKKTIAGLFLLACIQVSVFGQYVNGPVNKSASGTTSATVIVEGGNAPVELTDVGFRFDAGVTTGLLVVQSGDAQYDVASATAASTSIIWFTNTGTAVAVGEYVILFDESTGDHYLRRVNAATTTSVTVQASIGIAQTILDKVWSVDSTVERPVTGNPSATSNVGRVWLPAGRPTALTVDGNTTACRISVSGVRGNTK